MAQMLVRRLVGRNGPFGLTPKVIEIMGWPGNAKSDKNRGWALV